MTIPKSRLGCIVVVAVIVLLVISGLVIASIVLGDRAVRIDYYRVVDQQTLVVGAETDSHSWTRVTSVVETGTTVTITVGALPLKAPLPGAGGGQGVELMVKLRDPIGSRRVVDGSRGETVQLTRCLPPTTMRPECL
jgi:hypothetical protein